MSTLSERGRLQASCPVKVIITPSKTHIMRDDVTCKTMTLTRARTSFGKNVLLCLSQLLILRHTCMFIFVPEQGAALLEDFGAKITWVDAVFQSSLLNQ